MRTLACSASPAYATLAFVIVVSAAPAGERVERFDVDPGWEGHNNRSAAWEPRTIRQDFGYSPTTANAGGAPGEIGGLITPAAEAAYYAAPIEQKTFDDELLASGRLWVEPGASHVLVGFFNSQTVNEWRTPNSIAIRILGRGDHFFAYVEYATSRWRAGGDHPGGFATSRDPATGRENPVGFKAGVSHKWTVRYDPLANEGAGSINVTIGNETSVCHLSPEHRRDGATFDRFGLLPVLKSADSGGEIWLDDISINGQQDDFTSDPKWEGRQNRREYVTTNIRPRFDFGFSPTRFAGGRLAGELGGLVFRGDCREPARMAAYGDRLETLTLDTPLRASGKVALRRGVSDSTALVGFYHSRDSLAVDSSQSSAFPRSFLGFAVEGPSREGFLIYPAYRIIGDGHGYARGGELPHILPDGVSHTWSLEYDPSARDGRITVTFDGEAVSVDLDAAHRAIGSRFDRFGIVTTWIDGNAQQIYFDDLTYTSSP